MSNRNEKHKPKELDRVSFQTGARWQRKKMLEQGWRPPVTGDPENEAPGAISMFIAGVFIGLALWAVVIILMGV